MIDFRLPNGEDIDIDAGTTLRVAGSNPLFSIGEIPGTRVYRFRTLNTKKNKINFGFAHRHNLDEKTRKIEDVDLYIHKTRWKRGVLRVTEAGTEGYELSFHTDAGAISQKLKGRTMQTLDLGSDPLDLVTIGDYPTMNYVMFPVKNAQLYYAGENSYNGYVNNWSGGAYLQNDSTNKTKYSITPMPYLVHILDKLFQALGYQGVAGAWTEDATIRKVVLYASYALDELDVNDINVWQSTVYYNRLVPDMDISTFLAEVALYFGIMYQVDEKENRVNIVRIKDVLADQQYVDLSALAAKQYKISPNKYSGITFKSNVFRSDELLRDNMAWLIHKVDGGGRMIETDVDTLSMRYPDYDMPQTRHLGSSPEFNTGFNKTNIRFLLFEGMVDDGTGTGGTMPKGNYKIPALSLRWGDANGMVNSFYSDYIDFQKTTEKVSRSVRMTVPQFLNLDMNRKVMIDGMKYLIGEYSAGVSRKTGLGEVEMKLWKTLL